MKFQELLFFWGDFKAFERNEIKKELKQKVQNIYETIKEHKLKSLIKQTDKCLAGSDTATTVINGFMKLYIRTRCYLLSGYA